MSAPNRKHSANPKQQTAATFLADLGAWFSRSVGFPERFDYELAATYATLTHCADRFEAVPYLHFLGSPESGKTRALKVVSSVCRKSLVFGASTTAATIFRLIEEDSQRTLCLNEYAPRYPELLDILKAGYEQGLSIYRCEAESHQPRAYRCFGPKILAGEEPITDSALLGRVLEIRMNPGRMKAGQPLHLGPDFYSAAAEWQTRLSEWAQQQAGLAPNEPLAVKVLGHGRAAQIAAPLLAINPAEQFVRDLVARLRGMSADSWNDSLEGIAARKLVELAGEKPTVRSGDWLQALRAEGVQGLSTKRLSMFRDLLGLQGQHGRYGNLVKTSGPEWDRLCQRVEAPSGRLPVMPVAGLPDLPDSGAR